MVAVRGHRPGASAVSSRTVYGWMLGRTVHISKLHTLVFTAMTDLKDSGTKGGQSCDVGEASLLWMRKFLIKLSLVRVVIQANSLASLQNSNKCWSLHLCLINIFIKDFHCNWKIQVHLTLWLSVIDINWQVGYILHSCSHFTHNCCTCKDEEQSNSRFISERQFGVNLWTHPKESAD